MNSYKYIIATFLTILFIFSAQFALTNTGNLKNSVVSLLTSYNTHQIASVVSSVPPVKGGKTITLVKESCTGYTEGVNCFTSLSAWESAYGGIDFASVGCTAGDLVCADTTAVAKIDGAWTKPDIKPVNINGWTTNVTHYIKIYTTPSARHHGKWDDTKYRLIALKPLTVLENYTQVEGLQVGVDTTTNYSDWAIGSSYENNIGQIYDKLIIKKYGGTYTAFRAFRLSDYTSAVIRNSIIYGFKGENYGAIDLGLDSSTHYLTIQNTTIYNSVVGIKRVGGGYTKLQNVISVNNSTADFNINSGSWNVESNHNLSSDATAPGANSKTNQTISFVSTTPGSEDFHLSPSDTSAKDEGIDLSSDTNLAFTTDIDGQTRTAPWDIGADEYIGVNTSNAQDTTPSTISSIKAVSSQISATINWTTNEKSTSQVEYGLTTNYGILTIKYTTLITSHSVALSNLKAGTTYHYRVISTDASNNSTTSTDHTFKTISPDTTAPSTPTNIKANSVSSSQIKLTWTASTDNTGVTGYNIFRCTGTGSSCTPTIKIATSATNSYSDTGLTASTTYAYVVSAFDGSGNVSGRSGVVGSLTDAMGVSDILLQSTNFKYLGAFRVPKSDMGGPKYQGLAYGGSVIAYNPAHNSLFIVGHDHNQEVGEISIPEIINSPNLSGLKTAKIIQNLSDITEGNLNHLGVNGEPIVVNGAKIGGLLVYGSYLLGSSYAYYDGEWKAVRSHFISGLTTTALGDFKGMFQVGIKPSPVPQAGFIAGYMTPIPSNWQKKLGGKVLTGMSALSILGRTSSGPAAFAFNPDQLGAKAPAPAKALLYYPINHQTIGTYYTSRTIYNKGTHISGVIFPSGTRSILYIGRQGLGDACYGPGTNIKKEQWNRYNNPYPNNLCMGKPMTDTSDPCCYDPETLSKGAHAYPYTNYVWAYDAKDLARVEAGGRIKDDPSSNLVESVSLNSTEIYKPWDIKPYATWKMEFPYPQKSCILSGASAYDESTKRLFVVEMFADNERPVVHVYKLNIPFNSNTIISTLTTLPTISSQKPTGSLPQNTTSTTISVKTESGATCKFSTTPNVAYTSMTKTMIEKTGVYSATVSELTDGKTYNYYVKCRGASGKANTTDTNIRFNIAKKVTTFTPTKPSAHTTASSGGGSTASNTSKATHTNYGASSRAIATNSSVNAFKSTQTNTQTVHKTVHNTSQISQTSLFTHNLWFGLHNSEVTKLQKTLARDRTIYPEGITSGYYGNLTTKAVRRFQCKYGIICGGTARSTGYGVFGPRTRAEFNRVYGIQTSTVQQTTTHTPTVQTTPKQISLFTHNLWFGLHNSEVTKLQKTLARDRTIYPEGITSGYYGNLTTKAVRRFQCKYGIICGGTARSTGYGVFGPRTRAEFNRVY